MPITIAQYYISFAIIFLNKQKNIYIFRSYIYAIVWAKTLDNDFWEKDLNRPCLLYILLMQK